eukprot:3220014-Karenia_brevis.AAC.1
MPIPEIKGGNFEDTEKKLDQQQQTDAKKSACEDTDAHGRQQCGKAIQTHSQNVPALDILAQRL